ncbi:hypothetical protein BKA70DRAFT_120111 [Coprinopsis sp. MPI-PUGE-AT-0042]|nr:hypothetical protein BKA70DRAFT_120111 [Coprinopsis sp. MPI-PUGE-AT-0042]
MVRSHRAAGKVKGRRPGTMREFATPALSSQSPTSNHKRQRSMLSPALADFESPSLPEAGADGLGDIIDHPLSSTSSAMANSLPARSLPLSILSFTSTTRRLAFDVLSLVESLITRTAPPNPPSDRSAIRSMAYRFHVAAVVSSVLYLDSTGLFTNKLSEGLVSLKS